MMHHLNLGDSKGIISQGETMKDKYQIRKVRRGKGEKAKFIYAELYVDGELVISSTLEYIDKWLKANTEE